MMHNDTAIYNILKGLKDIIQLHSNNDKNDDDNNNDDYNSSNNIYDKNDDINNDDKCDLQKQMI